MASKLKWQRTGSGGLRTFLVDSSTIRIKSTDNGYSWDLCLSTGQHRRGECSTESQAMTAWIPESFSGLRIENLAVYIMQVFNTAGNRAIMIGIALGIASTSLKVLLGIDRSYLGSQED